MPLPGHTQQQPPKPNNIKSTTTTQKQQNTPKSTTNHQRTIATLLKPHPTTTKIHDTQTHQPPRLKQATSDKHCDQTANQELNHEASHKVNPDR